MKKLLLALGILILLGLGSILLLEHWLVNSLSEKINTDEDRAYDILYESIDAHIFRGNIELQGISVQPVKDGMATTITGTMKTLRLGGINIFGLIFGDIAEVSELRLEDPKFILIRNDSISKQPKDLSQAFQALFGDLVSRGVIHNFTLNNGSGDFYNLSDSARKFGNFEQLYISASNLETDSARANYAIPFKLESIKTSLKNFQIILSDEQTFTMGSMSYDSKLDAFDFDNMQLKYKESNLVTARQSNVQNDYIEIDLKKLKIERINARSSIYGNWSIVAGLITIDSLNLHDVRNKNKPRPISEPVKPMFEGMVEMISFPLEVDTIRVLNSKITYSQISEGKHEPGSLIFEQLSALVTHVVSIDSLQSGEMKIHGKAMLNGFAPMRMDVTVPYTSDSTKENFHLTASVAPFKLPSLNGILGDLVSVNINSGTMEKLEITMNATRFSSTNFMKFHYQDLKLELRDEEQKKKKIKSTLANILTSSSNLPEDRNYRTATYKTERNIYRGTFNLIWESLREGMLEIAPSELMQMLMKEQDPSDKGKRR
ncbi:hypothetical protein LV84_00042 [Algoriphagus ratkowskyi]|uniref:AsmA-like protein n=1 Tax=Algoriphagus ratkowskyi TaxID=57028 RepID=A0A2W7RKZ1_9BACT|nr:hypothetical protein [Algoriphagus ratkowskyi]PZX61054.1 hypothetical protein LV84_00042 [Algoriphagus ratkowskyi]TXD79190.1 hypothetical protein ESW18_02840 [Algoriphagus ratkowskyi]